MNQEYLHVYLLLEALFILLVLSGFLFWRLRKLRLRLEEAWRAFDEIVAFHRRDLVLSGNKALLNDASCYLDTLEKLAAEEPPGAPESWKALWKELIRPVVKVVEKAAAAEAGQSGQELHDLELMLDRQGQQIAELTAYKNQLLQLLRGKIEHIRHFNQDLLSSVRHLMSGQSDVQGLLEVVARLEENNENLHAMVGELEKSKMLMEPQLEALVRDNHRLRGEASRHQAHIRDLVEQKQLRDAKLAELAKKLDQCSQTNQQLQQRYEDLQQDYLKLLK